MASSYVFPESHTFSNSTNVGSSLESLQFEYFSTTYDVLRSSLAESEALLVKDQHYSPAELRLRVVYQGLTARVLAALAPRYQPSLVPELNGLAQKLSAQLPANVAQMSQFTAARLSGDQTSSLDPELAIPVAISKGDFQEASRLVDSLKSDDLRKAYSQLLLRTQAKFLLANAELLNALSASYARLKIQTRDSCFTATPRGSHIKRAMLS